MGVRYTTRLYKPRRKLNIKTAVLAAAEKIGAFARVVKDNSEGAFLQLGESSGIITAEFPYCDGDSIFFRELAGQLRAIWLEVRIQEGSHWDYTLAYPGRTLDTFSTLPNYFEEDELMALSQQGRPEILAKAWDVPQSTIANYIRQWDASVGEKGRKKSPLKGKAYPEDQYGYGEYEQVFDLLSKLHYTAEMKWFFELRIPKRNFSLRAV